MPFVDFKESRIVWKVVYYGPGLSGKTTNLKYLATLLGRTRVQSIAGEGERTVFFDYLPVEFPKVDGMVPVFKLFTAPGQVKYSRTRKVLLNGVDGIVFVADSQKPLVQNNLDSLAELDANLREVGIDPAAVCTVYQWNKQDLPNAFSPDVLEQLLNERKHPTVAAVAATGYNVKETVDTVGNLMVRRFFDRRDEEFLEEINNMEIRKFVDFFKDEAMLARLKFMAENGEELRDVAGEYKTLAARVERLEKAIVTLNKVLEGVNSNLARLNEDLQAQKSRGFLGLFRKR
jgi:signal recognition particle receptor subunit beta